MVGPGSPRVLLQVKHIKLMINPYYVMIVTCTLKLQIMLILDIHVLYLAGC